LSSRRVFIIHSGGTIGMRESDDGLVPSTGFLEQQMDANPVFQAPSMPSYEIGELEPLLDSAEMTPSDWVRIAGAIRDRYDDYDGFVILHGTDTMAYSASALAFMLEGLSKTVLLTGSQIPLCRPRNDAQDNLIASMILAADYRIPEVGLFFGSRLLRGCRSVKVSSSGFRAFDSPNLPPLATAGVQITVNRELIRWPADPSRQPRLRLHESLDPSVGMLWLFPGMTGDIVRNFLQPPLKGVVLQAYGVGNGPVGDPEFVRALSEAHERGVVIVDCTQCLVGSVDVGGYATGSGMARAGAISGYDMTPEAALTKMMHLFGRGYEPAEVRRWMQRSLRGELTEAG
jgi:L-asparaginase